MAKTVVVFHSGYGHTQRVAQFVAQGANAQLVTIDTDGNIVGIVPKTDKRFQRDRNVPVSKVMTPMPLVTAPMGIAPDDALAILAQKKKSITYLYFPELDSIAHAYGVESTEWRNKLEELDASLKALASNLPKDAGLLVTADHGIVDVPRANHILLDELELPGLVAVTGDPRNTFLYFEEGLDVSEARAYLEAELAGQVLVATVDELKANGWLSNEISNSNYLPNLFLLAVGNFACYHRKFCKPQSLRMIGQHGSISQAELSVPLLRFGTYQN